MIKDIDFLSVKEMKRIRPAQNIVVVSILDRSESIERPRLSGFRGALTLEFEDTSEEAKKHEPGSWADEPTDEEHAQFSLWPGERAPTLSDAVRIVNFIRHHHAGADDVTLIAHCHGGISRSAAVAHWASVRLWVPMSKAGERSTERANPRLLRLLDKAAGVY